jgi:ribosome biogenesis SPOUT family RNA methylase Rps3
VPNELANAADGTTAESLKAAVSASGSLHHAQAIADLLPEDVLKALLVVFKETLGDDEPRSSWLS